MSDPVLTSATRDAHARLVRLITAADHAYYGESRPTLSDAEYDALLLELRRLDATWPELRAMSPARRVGQAGSPAAGAAAGPATGGEGRRVSGRTVTHLEPMLSLGNVHDEGALEDWARGTVPEGETGAWAVELKIDGLSQALRYQDGRLVSGATRGDGTTGEDVTAAVRALASVPQTLAPCQTWPVPPVLEVRGEVYLPLSRLEAVNVERQQQGEDAYRNARNAASGLLRTLDTAAAARAGLAFYAYALVVPAGTDLAQFGLDSQHAVLDRLAAWGFAVSPQRARVTTVEALHAAVAAMAASRDGLDFGIDGAVVKVDAIARQRALGAASREPRWAVARKWPAERVASVLQAVQYQVGRTGRVTPVAVVAPVDVGGVTVTNATLHNADYIAALDLHVGDRVFLTRAGEVIPQILGVDAAARPAGATPVRFPTACPACGGALTRPEGAADTYCPSEACVAQRVRRLLHATSRTALDIRGLGAETAEALVAAGLVRDWADLYGLRVQDIAGLDRQGETSARALVAEIAAARTRSLDRVLVALGVRHLGRGASRLLVSSYGTLERLCAATTDDLLAIKGIGPEIATSVVTALAGAEMQDLFARLVAHGVRPVGPVVAAPTAGQAAPDPMDAGQQTGGAPRLTGLTFVVTGTLSAGREAIEAEIRALGGTVAGSVSARTAYLVAGENSGAGKTQKAAALGVRVIDEATLRSLFAGAAIDERAS